MQHKRIGIIGKSLVLLAVTLSFSPDMQAQIPQKAENVCPLLIGTTLPDARLDAPGGQSVRIMDLVSKKPTVLVFYRGGWCPYRNKQLAGLGKLENEILKLGYQIIAVSPDNAQQAQATQSKNTVAYQVLADPSGEFIKKMGIAFATPSSISDYLTTQNRKAAEVMPAPAVFIVSREGKILFEYINPNYKERIPENMLLAVLQSQAK